MWVIKAFKVHMQPTILDRLAQRVSLKTDTEEFRLASKTRKALSKIKSKQKGTKKVQEARGGLSSMGARNIYIKDHDIYSRRVIVKARYVKNNGTGFKEKIRAHLEYISRSNSGMDGEKPELFSKDDIPIVTKDIVKKLEESPYNFRFIISPEDGAMIDMKLFTKDLVRTIEKDLQTKLEWVASCHYDTNEPHVHIVINGMDGSGKKLLLSRDYISRGIRNRASEIINKKIGLRNLEEIAHSLKLDAYKNKKCELDTIIKNNTIDGVIDLSKINNNDYSEDLKDVIYERLAHLQRSSLAVYVSENKWRIKDDYIHDLHQINRTRSIIEKLSSYSGIEKAHCEVISAKKLSEESIVGHVVSRGVIDEIDDAEYIVIKTSQQKQIYVELERYSEKSRVNIGDFVRVDTTKPFDGPKNSDRSINEIAHANGGIYKAAVHEEYARTHKKLPPGVSAQEFAQVHLKRLEAVAKMGLVRKLDDKIFSIPPDFLERIAAYAQASLKKYKLHIKVTRVSEMTLTNQIKGLRLKP